MPAALSAVTMKAMALHQNARYSGVPEFQAEIVAYQNGFATTAEKAGPLKQFLHAPQAQLPRAGGEVTGSGWEALIKIKSVLL